jgi:hypothetical protein
MTFEDTLDWQKTVAPIGLQILNQVELMEVAGAKPIEEVISRPII